MMTIPTKLVSLVPQSLHAIVENYWQDWVVACEKNSINVEEDLSLPLLGKTWASSDFFARNSIRYPEALIHLCAEDLGSTRTIENYQYLVKEIVNSDVDESQLMTSLRELRQKEMMRIAWRDLNNIADDETVLKELSDFAEAVVVTTLQYLENQQAVINGMPHDSTGEAQALLVLAMGKMGGGELNFSSDIDLIFTYAEDGETSGPRRVSHTEFYLAVIRKFVKVLDQITADGFVYRVDTRLRPFGESGALAISFSGMEQYYQRQGRDWERYALIKAKYVSGREQDKKYLQSMLTPFVYRRYLDFSMLESIREMKAMIDAQMKRKRMLNNIKLGPGGIREIEFIGQTLQLIRAGREPDLRNRSIVKVLNLLAEKKYLIQSDVEKIIQAYWFLRKLENRLQMLNDKQTHSLPEDDISQRRIALAMSYDNWDQLLDQLSLHQNSVDRVFHHLVTPENEKTQVTATAFNLFWEGTQDNAEVHESTIEALSEFLVKADYSNVDEIIVSLQQLRDATQFKHLADDSWRKLTRLIESLVIKIADYPEQTILLDRVGRIVKALAGRKVYLSLLLEYPEIQLQMLTLSAASDWFAERLVKHPVLLDSLLSTAEVFRKHVDVKALLELELSRVELLPDGNDDLEQQMDRLRQFKRKMVFAVAMLDVFYDEPVERVSDRLTDLSNHILEKVFELSWQAMVLKHGEPACVVNDVSYVPRMSVIAYGKMGGNELGYGSDLDIIFLHNSEGSNQFTSGNKSIDNQQFFARVAQRVIHFLNTMTYSGALYEIDTRLRPDGQAGLMVSSIVAFEGYQRERAWTWEHQALIRARFVTGGELLHQEFDRIRGSVLRISREPEKLLQEVVSMREKMRGHLANKSADFDVKHDSGGLVDIEFMTQAGVLVFAEKHAACIEHTATLPLINELTSVGWYSKIEGQDISAAYRYFRQLKNWQNLACETDDAKAEEHRGKVLAVWHRLMPVENASQTE